MADTSGFVRFQAAWPDRRGGFPGVFSMVNRLAKRGRLSPEEERFWRRMNDWYDAAYPNPSLSHPNTYDRARNPGAAAWFRGTATHLIAPIGGYLRILDAHRIGYRRLASTDPGRIIYQDAYQIVVTPRRSTLACLVTQLPAGSMSPTRPRAMRDYPWGD
jgi:hypothetical protein